MYTWICIHVSFVNANFQLAQHTKHTLIHVYLWCRLLSLGLLTYISASGTMRPADVLRCSKSKICSLVYMVNYKSKILCLDNTTFKLAASSVKLSIFKLQTNIGRSCSCVRMRILNSLVQATFLQYIKYRDFYMLQLKCLQL